MMEAGIWLSSVEGQRYSRFVSGLRSAVVEFEKDSEQFETGNISKIRENTDLQHANSVGSEYTTSFHKPVLDLDMDAMLVPSSTPGHWHLYIDHLLSWDQYKDLMECLGRVGILQKGYVRASIARKGSWVRTPWTRKGDPMPEVQK